MRMRVQVTASGNAGRGFSLRRRRTWYGDDDPTPPGDEGGEQSAAPQTLTQDEVNALLGKTRKEARTAAQRAFLEELGFTSPDELKALVKSAKERDEASKSEAQKALERAQAAEQARLEALAQLEGERRARQMERRDAALENVARSAGAKYPDDVVTWLAKNEPDALASTVADDGSVDTKALGALVSKHKSARPELYKSGAPGTPSNSDGGEVGDKQKQDILKQIKVRF